MQNQPQLQPQPGAGQRHALFRAWRALRAASAMLCLLGLAHAPAAAALFGEDPPIENFRPIATSTALESMDHSAWDRFLALYLVTEDASGVHLVRYDAVTREDRLLLDAYIAELASARPDRYTPSVQMAYWINLYNAVTVRVILDHPGVDSIREIRDGLFSIGPWNIPQVRVRGVELSLNDIEHRILRPLFGDPRIHFAVNCASLGCPDLAARAWTADRLEFMLDRATRDFLAHPRGLRLEGNTLHLSSIFDWYAQDFGTDRHSRLQWIALHAPTAVADRVRHHDGRLRHDYDWSLNRAP